MSSIVECPNFEILFSKKEAILSFSCDDLPAHPGVIKSVDWLADGFAVQFEKDDATHAVHFAGAPSDVLVRVATHQKILIVGLTKGDEQFSPQVAVSEDMKLPER